MNKHQQLTIILLLVSTTLSGNLAAKIYTWTDEHGKVHFSDKPIVNENVTTVEPSINNNVAETVTKDNQWQQNYNKNKQAKAEKAKESAEEKKKKQYVCNRLKSKLATIEQGGRLYAMSPEGERSYYSDTQLKAENKKLTKAIKKTCR